MEDDFYAIFQLQHLDHYDLYVEPFLGGGQRSH